MLGMHKDVSINRMQAIHTRKQAVGRASYRFRVGARPGGLVVRAALASKGKVYKAESLVVQKPLGEGSYGQVFEVSAGDPST